jgi:hypothetical protein
MNIITKKEIIKRIPNLILDLKHSSKPEDQILNPDNLKRMLYHQIILDISSEENFLCIEKLNDGTSREGIFVKGYIRDVWQYLEDSYEIIHKFDYSDYIK